MVIPTAMQQASSPPAAAHLRGLPAVGVLPRIARMGMLDFLGDAWKKHGDFFRFDLGPRRMVAMAHPDAIEHVLVKNRANYVKGRTYNSIRPLTGAGLLTLEGEAWKKRRRLAQPAFHRERLHDLVGTMVDVTRSFLDQHRRDVGGGAPFDAHEATMRLTLDVVGATLFGQRLSHDAKDGSGEAFGTALVLLTARAHAPVPVPRWVPTPANRRLTRALDFTDAMVREIIQRARGSSGAESPTLLRMLLESLDAETGERLTDQELRDEVVTLVLAGHETTALLLSWGFTLLGPRPDVVARMRAEVDDVLGGRDPRSDDLPKLVYMGRVIDEILRVRPPIYAVARDVVGDDVVMGHRVHAGEIALPLIFLAHQHPSFWESPESFDPERFRGDRTERNGKRHHGAYAPFSLGARMCIGNVFTLIEAKIILAMLLQRADFELLNREPIKRRAAMTVRPATPITMRMTFRA
jgi:cytochrome P450